MSPGKIYRQCVLAVVVDSSGKVLVGERSDHANVWQCPQGGIEDGESPKLAALRELAEETGLRDVDIIKESAQSFCYDFPPEMRSSIAKKWRGQCFYAFVMQIKSGEPDLSLASSNEFVRFDWMHPQAIIEQTVSWKKIALQGCFHSLLPR